MAETDPELQMTETEARINASTYNMNPERRAEAIPQAYPQEHPNHGFWYVLYEVNHTS